MNYWPDRNDVDEMISYSAWKSEVEDEATLLGFRDWEVAVAAVTGGVMGFHRIEA
jgi:hypothetical protein